MNSRKDGRGLIVAVLLTVLLVIGCSDSNDRANIILSVGIKHFDAQEFSKAQQAFNRSLKLDNRVAEPYFYLGKIALFQGDVTAAVNYYKKAIALKQNYIGARIHLGRVYANAQQLSEAQAQVDAIILSDVANNDARALQALIMLKQGKSSDAEASLQNILKSVPENVLATEILARYYLSKGDENNALQILEQANKSTAGTEDKVLKQLFSLYTNRKLSSEAEQVLLQLVKNNQGNLQYYRGLIQFYAGQDRLNDAVLIIRNSISNDPDNTARYQLLIDLYKSRYGLRQAINETRQLINDKPEMSYLRLALARLYTADKQTSKAETVYQGVADMDGTKPNGLIAKIEVAKFHLQRKEAVKAEQLISEVLAINPKQENALLLRSGIAMQRKDFAQASLMLDMVIQENPDNIQGRMQKAVLLARQSKLDEALVHIDAVLEKNDSLLSVLKLKVKILTQQRKYDQLASVFTKLETASPNSTNGFLGNAKLLLGKKKYSKALLKFEKAYLLDPDSVEALRGVVTTKINLDEAKSAKQLLEKIIKNSPQHPVAIELLGSIYLSRNEYVKAEKEFQRQLDVGTTSKSIYIQLAQSRMKQDDQKNAIAALITGIEKQPRNLKLRIKLAQVYVLANELVKAEETLETTITLAPRNAQLKSMLKSVRSRKHN